MLNDPSMLIQKILYGIAIIIFPYIVDVFVGSFTGTMISETSGGLITELSSLQNQVVGSINSMLTISKVFFLFIGTFFIVHSIAGLVTLNSGSNRNKSTFASKSKAVSVGGGSGLAIGSAISGLSGFSGMSSSTHVDNTITEKEKEKLIVHLNLFTDSLSSKQESVKNKALDLLEVLLDYTAGEVDKKFCKEARKFIENEGYGNSKFNKAKEACGF